MARIVISDMVDIRCSMGDGAALEATGMEVERDSDGAELVFCWSLEVETGEEAAAVGDTGAAHDEASSGTVGAEKIAMLRGLCVEAGMCIVLDSSSGSSIAFDEGRDFPWISGDAEDDDFDVSR